MFAVELRKSVALCLFGSLSAAALADTFVFQPFCDNVWQSCCPLSSDTMANNWGRTSPAPVCPAQPTAADSVTITTDCVVGPSPLSAVAAGTLLQSGGTFTLNHSLGVTDATFDGPVIWDVGGEIARGTGNSGQARCNGGINIIGSGDKTIGFFGAFTLINAGAAQWTGTGSLTIGMTPGGCCPTIFQNDPGATFSVQTNAPIVQNAFGLGRIDNFGTITKENSNGLSSWTATLNNSGLVHVKTGELRLLAGGSADGDFVVDSGAILAFSGTATTLLPGVNISGQGSAIVTDSNTNMSVAINETITLGRIAVASTGRIGGTGWMQISDLLTVQDGGDVTVRTRILPGGRLECVGSSADFWFNNLEIGGVAHIPTGSMLNAANNGLTVLPGGSIEIEDGGLLQPTGNGVQPIENHGLIRKTPGSGDGTIASAFGWYLNNYADGTLKVDGGSLICQNRLETYGQIQIAAGAEFRQRGWGGYYAGASITGPGWFHLENAPNNFIEDGFNLVISRLRLSGNVNGGAGFSGPGSLTIAGEAELRGGGMFGPLVTIQPGALVNVNGPDFSTAYGLVEHYGTTHSNGADFSFGNFNNHAGALVNLHGDYYFGGRFGGTFNNQGTLQKSGGTGDSDLGGTLNNSNQVTIQSGRLRMNNYIQTAGTTQLFGTGIRAPSLQLNGGVITGAATLTVNFTNNGGVFQPGGSGPGLVTINSDPGVFGSYTQNANGSMVMQIGGLTPGSGHDQLHSVNNLALGGTLNLQLVNGYVPNVGDSFVILTCGGVRIGQFAQIAGTQIGGGKQFSVQYNQQNVTVTVIAGGTMPGDLDGDGHVSLQDLATLLASFGICGGQAGYNAAADLDGDGCVAISDLAVLLSHFGN